MDGEYLLLGKIVARPCVDVIWSGQRAMHLVGGRHSEAMMARIIYNGVTGLQKGSAAKVPEIDAEDRVFHPIRNKEGKRPL